MQHNCPVCNKAGLPDYRAIATTCPQCNSDLRPYLFLNSISNSKSTKNKPWALTGVGLLTVVLAFLFFNSVSENKKQSTENLKLTSQLQDSISNLQSQLKLTSVKEPIVNPTQSETVIEYKVRFGDYPSKIAQFFFNDWKMYKKIEADNNLVQPYTLKVGQTLKIKIPQ